MNKLLIAKCALLAGVLAALDATPAEAAGPARFPNDVRYRVSEPGAATGRSGNATLSVRALVDANDTTVVEVGTGDLDWQDPLPGNISSLQLKAFRSGGGVAWIHSYPHLAQGGRLQYSFDHLRRGQRFQAQANVRGIDNRTDVVTVEAQVKRLPDLAVVNLDAPAQATAWAPVLISASISELNGDVGGLGNCQLWVDGTQVDEAAGIYVDGGDTVSCAFTHGFNAVGLHSFEVRISDVTPNDWDGSNNQATGEIEILPASASTFWTASANHLSSESSDLYEGWYRFQNPSYDSNADWHNEHASTGEQKYFFLFASTSVPLTFPLQFASAELVSDGDVAVQSLFPNIEPDYVWGDSAYGGESVLLFDEASFSFIYVNVSHYGGLGLTSTSFQKFAGTATYFSSEFAHFWGTGYDSTYSFNQSTSDASGVPWNLGTAVALDLEIVDATGFQVRATPSLSLEPYSFGYDQEYTCLDQVWANGAQHECTARHALTSGIRADAFGEN